MERSVQAIKLQCIVHPYSTELEEFLNKPSKDKGNPYLKTKLGLLRHLQKTTANRPGQTILTTIISDGTVHV